MILYLVCVSLILIALVVRYSYTRSDTKAYYAGKVVLLTGASDGIGAALAETLARNRCKLVICARREELLQKVATACRAFTEVLAVQCDVGNEEQCKRLVSQAVEKFGRLDVVILNAAVSHTRLFEDTRPEDNFFHIQVNYMQAVYILHAALPHLRKTHGKFVGISSVAAHTAPYGNSAYAASKCALEGFLRTVRQEIGRDIDIVILPIGEVRTATAVNNLHPRGTSTSSWKTPEECAREIAAITASKRTFYIFEWRNWFGVVLRPLFPCLFDWFTLQYIKSNFEIEAKRGKS